MIAAVIFDLDGLLADTEILHCRAWQTTLKGHGITLTADFYRDWWVRQGRGISDLAMSKKLSIDVASLQAEKDVQFARLVDNDCVAMTGALELLDHLEGRKKLAVASSSWANAVQSVLGKLGIAKRFDTIVTGNEVRKAKPFPDVFLLAAQRLGIAAGQCVVLEDAEKGVLAAKTAKMKCIAVPNGCTADNDFSQATRVVASLHEITMHVIDALGS